VTVEPNQEKWNTPPLPFVSGAFIIALLFQDATDNEHQMDQATSIEIAKEVLRAAGVICAAGTLCGFVAKKTHIPDVVLLLIVGMLLGPEFLNIVDMKNNAVLSSLSALILIFGASYILFDGGATVRLKVLKEVWITITVLATAGVVITAAVTSLAAYYFLNLPVVVAMLLGAVIASTDPATLVPIFRQIKVSDRVAHTVMSESAFNDATGAILTFAVLGFATSSASFSPHAALGDFAWQTAIGIGLGVLFGYLAAITIAHDRYNFLAAYAPVVSLAMVTCSYVVADAAQASGFMAVFAFGITLGNRESFGLRMSKEDDDKLDYFTVTTAFLMRMFIFILLGTQVDFALMNKYLVGGVALIVVFMLVARPIAVFACALPDRHAKWSYKEMLFMCWTRETGVIPGALAGILVGMKAPGAQIIASVTFIAILMTILIQGTTTKWLAAKLGLLARDEGRQTAPDKPAALKSGHTAART
jgi:potassium/hydrogen antiporter